MDDHVGEGLADARRLLVDEGSAVRQRLAGVEDRGQLLVLDFDQVERFLGAVRVDRGHGRHRLTDEPHLVEGERRLVAEDGTEIGEDAGFLDVVAGQDGRDARHLLGARRVDADDTRVGGGAAQKLGVEHSG